MRTHPDLGEIHPDSPEFGDVVVCTNKDLRLNDPDGYRVEGLGWSKGCGVPYGCFAARGVKFGGLYRFGVNDFKIKD